MTERVANLSTIILWAVIGTLITICISVGEWKSWVFAPRERIPDLILPAIELIVLAVSGGLSTSFCYITHYNLRKYFSVEDEDINFILWGGIRNTVLFVSAIYTVEYTELFLFVVLLIYVNYCRMNAMQLAFLLDDTTTKKYRFDSKGHFNSVVDTMMWLKEENGIAVLALTSVAFMIFVLTFFHVNLGHGLEPLSILEKNEFHSQIKAFIVGAAILHVVASMIKYFQKYLKDDVLDQSFSVLSANIDSVVDQISETSPLPTGTKDRPGYPEQIWIFSAPAKEMLNRSRRRWRWLVVTCTTLAFLFCLVSFTLNFRYHSASDIKLPWISNTDTNSTNSP